MSITFVFPGQGSQTVGMGKDLADAFPAARAVFQEVDEALGQKLSQIMWEGPQETLTLTENAQPALMAVSMAVVRVLEAEFGVSVKDHANFVAGHSLGDMIASGDRVRWWQTDERSMRATGESTAWGTTFVVAMTGSSVKMEPFHFCGIHRQGLYRHSSRSSPKAFASS